MLHTVNRSPLSSNSLYSALRIAAPGDPLLLLEDGVYAAMAGAAWEQALQAALVQHPIYALGADLEARGIERLIAGIQVTGYDGFVALVEQHGVVPWL